MEKNVWGYVSQEEVNPTQFENSWKFGLNQNVVLKSYEFHYAGKNDNGFDVGNKVLIKFGHKEDTDEQKFKKLYIFEPTKDKIYMNGNLLTEDDPNFEKQYEKNMNRCIRTILDLAECFYENEKVRDFLQTRKPSSFEEFAKTIGELLKMVKTEDVMLDLFLQYSSKLYEGKSYLEIPNAAMGHYVTKHFEGDYREERIENTSLKYYLYENDVKTDKMHPIMRGNFKPWWEKNAVKTEVKSESSELPWENNKPAEKPSDDIPDWSKLSL